MKDFLTTPDGRAVYSMLDNPRIDANGKKVSSTPPKLVSTWSQCERLNTGQFEHGNYYGIFWSVNQVKDGVRKIENVTKLLSWFVDIDLGTKESQLALIRKSLFPSMIIETKRGYQCYWNCLDATLENYSEIQGRLVHFFGADQNAKDAARILRVPFFYHQKDPSNPFLVKKLNVENEDKVYTEKKMLEFFPAVKKEIIEEEPKEYVRTKMSFIKDDSLFERIYNMDCEQALMRLSGHQAVACEKFSFKRVSKGKLNLLVDGKSTSVFIDNKKRIGSNDGGGPTIWNYINWYHGDHKKTYQYMKEIFPELFEDLKSGI